MIHNLHSGIDELYNDFAAGQLPAQNDTYTRILNEIRGEWYQYLPKLDDMDKPARHVVYPTIQSLELLLNDMYDDYQSGCIKSSLEQFKRTFVEAYDLLDEVQRNRYNSEDYV